MHSRNKIPYDTCEPLGVKWQMRSEEIRLKQFKHII